MIGRVRADNFFNTTINSVINDTSVSGTFDITSKTVNGYTLEDGDYIFWMIVGLDNQDELEIFRITNVSTNTLTYDRRISPNGMYSHASGQVCVMTVAADFFNYMSNNIDDFGYVEDIPGTGNELKVKVFGGRVYTSGAIDVTASDTILTLADASTLYIYYDDALNTFASTTVEPISEYVIAKVVTAAGDISSIEDYRSKVVSGGSGGGGSGGHTIKDTERDNDTVDTTYTQRDGLAFRKFAVRDDAVNLNTIIENEWLGTPDVIAATDTVYIDEDTQMLLEGGITVDGTLVNDGKLVIL